MKKWLKKKVYESREQYTGPTEQCHSSANLDCQRGGGSRAQCMGLTSRSVFTCFSII